MVNTNRNATSFHTIDDKLADLTKAVNNLKDIANQTNFDDNILATVTLTRREWKYVLKRIKQYEEENNV